MKSILLTLSILLTSLNFAQTIKGKVYDAQSTVKGALIVNISQNIMTYSKDNGDFNIEAKIKDSVYFSSLFHTKKMKIITEEDFQQTMIVEIEKTVNELDVVYMEKINEKKFDSVKVNTELKIQIKNDIEKNPHLYSPPSTGNMDFIAIAKLIAGLFKNKKKQEREAVTPIINVKHNELKAFFQKDSFFNESFLVLDLQITEEFQPLFFDYCDAKGIEQQLLEKENRFLLVDKLMGYSKTFRESLAKDLKD